MDRSGPDDPTAPAFGPDAGRGHPRRYRAAALLALAGGAVVMARTVSHSSPPPGPAFPPAPAQQEDAPPPPPGDPDAIVSAQRDLAVRALEMIDRSFERGVAETRLADAAFAASHRLLSSELFLSLPADGRRTLDPELYLTLDLAPATPERLASFERHLTRMRHWEDRFGPLVRDRIVSPLAFAELQSRRLQAEALLARERLRLDRPEGERP